MLGEKVCTLYVGNLGKRLEADAIIVRGFLTCEAITSGFKGLSKGSARTGNISHQEIINQQDQKYVSSTPETCH